MSLKDAKRIFRETLKEDAEISRAEEDIKKAKIYLGVTQVNKENTKVFLAIGLGILLLILIVLSLFTAKWIIGDKKTDVIYMENTRVIERQIQQNVTNNHIVTIPEGDRETCIKLNNESFRRCYDE